MDGEKAVSAKDVTKIFRLPLERHATLKSALINFSGRPRYVEQKALDKISFEVEKGEFFGIIGRNGSGKSTMLKLLAGIYTPTKGDIKVNGNLTPFIELGVGFNPELTGRENVFLNGALLGFNRKEMKRLYQDIVDFAEIEKFMDQKLKNYSSGMQVRLAFSIAIRAQSDILLIDEVLAVGDLLFQQKCYETFKDIKRQGRTVIFVSHDLGAVDSFCDRVMILNRGEFAGIGSPKEMITEYKSLLAREETEGHKGKGPKHIVSSGRTAITKGEVLVGGKPVKEIPEGSPFAVRVHYQAKEPITNPSFGIGLMDSEQNSVLGPNTREAGFSVEQISGRGYIEAAFNTNVLAPGPYSLRAGIFDESGAAPEDFVEDLLHFKISGKARYGLTYVEPRWRIEQETKN